MTLMAKEFTYAPPGMSGSPVPLKERYDNFIGGRWVEPKKGAYTVDLTPATGRPITEVPKSTAEDVELALDAAHAAKDAWAETSTTERSRILNAIADAIDANREMLAVAESWENGKPVRETLAADIPLAADHFRYFASVIRAEEGTITEIDKETISVRVPRAARRRRTDHPVQLPAPHGVVEDRPGARRGQRHGRQAGQPDAVVHPQADGAHRAHRPAPASSTS